MRVFCGAFTILLIAQAGFTQSPSSSIGPVTVSSAENSWQFSPVILEQQKDVAPSNIRARRTEYFATLLAPILNVQDDSTGSARFPGSHISASSDVPAESSPIWLVATFVSYAVFPVGTHGAYTEMYLNVQQVIVNRSVAQISPGNQIVVAFAGGTFTEADKHIRRFLVSPERYSMKPGGSYLLDLQYSRAENYFSLGKHWSIVNGVLVPDTEEDVALASTGKSSLAGLSTVRAASTIQKALTASK